MSLCRFVESLFDDGRITVPQIAPIAADELDRADRRIADFERQYRLEMPGAPPEFSPAAARWAAVRTFRGCQLAVYRDAGPEVVQQELGEPCRGAACPEVHYSVDLFFRYLATLIKFARSASEDDPLVEHLVRLATEWPLSSVGIADVGDVRIDAFAGHPALMRLYVDRIVATADRSRLADPRVRAALRAALGMHAELAPRINTTIDEYEAETEDVAE